MVKVAVVILNWNGERFLEQFLPPLIACTSYAGAQIIIADNASTDGSMQFLQTNYPSLRTIVLDQNYGFAAGYNKALEQIDAAYFVLLNSDVEVTPGWLDALMVFMEANPTVAACQPKIKAFYAKNYFEHAGAAGGFIDYLGFPFCRGRVFAHLEEDKGQYDEVVDVFWASGACLLIRADMFKKVGGLDEAFFAHMEEIDLCWRLNARGYRVVCVPQSTVYHVGGGTLNAESPRKTYLNFRNNLLMLYKNLPQQSLDFVLRWRKVLDYVAAVQLYATGKKANAAAVLQARKDFKAMKADFLEKRNQNLLHATHTNCNVMLSKSILIAYFLKKKKTYSSIIN